MEKQEKEALNKLNKVLKVLKEQAEILARGGNYPYDDLIKSLEGIREGKRQELRLNLSFGVVGCKDLAEARNQLEEAFSRDNTTAENEFWDNLELVEVLE